MTYDGLDARLYVNGELDFAASGQHQRALVAGSGGNFRFGPSAAVDELRVLRASQGPDWVATEFQNQNASETFVVMGPQETRLQAQ